MGPDAPAKRFYFQLVMDAIACYFGQVGRARERPGLQLDASRWIMAPEEEDLLSFNYACGVLGLSPSCMRHALRGESHTLSPAFDRLARPRRSAVASLPRDTIEEMANSRIPVPIIARRYGVSRNTIRRLLGPRPHYRKRLVGTVPMLSGTRVVAM